jgi:phosphopantothenoylcysteine decarboxylase/phosphopantothenate--cysteine ligase
MESPARVLLGVSGGIAAYKSCLLLRLLTEAGHEARVAMTRHAAHFVGPLTFSTLSGHPVAVDPFAEGSAAGAGGGQAAGHIDLSAWAEHLIVAPATANILGKAAQGIADDFLSTTICAFDKPILFAPAMNHRMWANPAVCRNVEHLRRDGHAFAEPDSGWLACGETGAGRMAEPARILETFDWLRLRSSELAGRRVVVSAGPTIEDLDEVRFLANHSSGRMGFALARAAQRMGAETRLVAGPVALETPLGVCRVDVRSAAQMARAMAEETVAADLVVMCAAVADYAPEALPGKRKKDGADWILPLRPTGDILAALAALPGRERRVHVGFALEVEHGAANALDKLRRKDLDLICLNNPRDEGAGFGAESNRVTILDRAGAARELPLLSKDEAAREILRTAARLLPEPGK